MAARSRRPPGEGTSMLTGQDLDRLDLIMGELASMLRVLLFINEASVPKELEHLRPGAVTMLYLMLDRAGEADRVVGHARAALLAHQQPGRRRRRRRQSPHWRRRSRRS